MHCVHERHPVVTLRSHCDLVWSPWCEAVQVKAGRRRWEREDPRCRSSASRWGRLHEEILDCACVWKTGNRTFAGGRSSDYRTVRRARSDGESWEI